MNKFKSTDPLPVCDEQHEHQDIEAIKKTLPEDDRFIEASDLFSLLSDSTRLKILWLLCHNEACVCDIASAIDMSSPAVSHHLKLLKSSGLIVSRREGKEMYYRTADTELAQVLHHTIEKLGKITCPES